MAGVTRIVLGGLTVGDWTNVRAMLSGMTQAHVYVLTERRDTAAAKVMDIYLVCGTQQEALGYYEKLKGRAPRTIAEVDQDGHSVLVIDEDSTGAAYVAQYKVGVSEFLD